MEDTKLEIVKEWVNSSWEDFSVAGIDFQAGKYRHSIINCHHALEKMSKAIYIRQHNRLPRKNHNIVEILRESYGEHIFSEIVDEDKQNFFAEVTSFYPGINYPDSRLYVSIDRLIAEQILNRTRSELEWLTSLLRL